MQLGGDLGGGNLCVQQLRGDLGGRDLAVILIEHIMPRLVKYKNKSVGQSVGVIAIL